MRFLVLTILLLLLVGGLIALAFWEVSAPVQVIEKTITIPDNTP